MTYTLKEIKDLVIKPNGKPYAKTSSVYTTEIKDWINENIKGNCNFWGKLILIMNNMTEVPKCKNPECNNEVTFGGSINKGFRNFCHIQSCSSSHKDTKRKYKETSLKNWGTENPLKNKEFRQICKDKIKEKYGSEYAMQSEVCKEKYKETSLKNWGTENPLSSKEVQEKCKDTLIERYGFPTPAQNRNIMEKILNSTKTRTHSYKDTNLYYQSSLEYYFLELMEEYNLLHFVKNGLTFRYNYLEVNDKLYVSDFYIEDLNLIIEIKSKWTYNRRGSNKILEGKNLAKRDTVLKSLYDFKFLIERNEINDFVNKVKDKLNG